VLVQGLLHYFLISQRNAASNTFGVGIFHEHVEVLLSNAKGFYQLNWFVEEFGYFVLDARAIVDWTYDLLG
jgi:hypothetical protein